MRARGASLLCLLLDVALVGGCRELAEVAVVVHVPGGSARAIRTEVSVVDSCGVVVIGRPADDALVTVEATSGPSKPLGRLHAGSYGLYARAWEVGCSLFAAGCDSLEVDGSAGTAEVWLQLLAPPRGCDPGDACLDGACVAGDPPDGGPAPCDDSRDCDDGRRCNGTETCEAGRCVTTPPPDCEPVAGVCEVDLCDEAGGCGVEAAPDGTQCDDGDPCTALDLCTGGLCVGARASVDPAPATSDGGYAYIVGGSYGGTPDNNDGDFSTLRLFEDRQELGPAHAPHLDIRNLGAGRFSHYSNTDGSGESLRFSASDNSDPKENGRSYTYCVPPQ